MNDEQKIWEDPEQALAIHIEPAPSKEVIAFLREVVWGSRSLRYRIPDLGERLRRLRAPTVFVLKQEGRLASVCILDRCEKTVLGRPFDAFHFVMVATTDDDRKNGLAGLLMAEVRRFCERELRHPGLGFGYVESTTVYSLRISERIGSTFSAEMPLILFSRIWPSDDGRVGLATPQERAGIVSRLGALYSGHELADFDASVDTERFLVLREDDQILAGVQVEELTWSVVSLPGLTGRFLLWLLPYVPFVKGRLNPRHLPLLRFGNVLGEPGREAALVTLLEAALARHDASFGLMMMDRRSPVLGRILDHGRLGYLSSVVNGSVTLRGDFVGVAEEEIAEIVDRPMLASAADIF